MPDYYIDAQGRQQPERRRHRELRQIFEPACALVAPFVDPEQRWSGRALTGLAFRALRDAYPELPAEALRILIEACQRRCHRKHSAAARAATTWLLPARPGSRGRALIMSPVSTSHTPAASEASPRGREYLPLQCDDLASFAKSLRAQLAEHLGPEASVPGHVQMLNMLARAAGHRNVQALKAQAAQQRSALARARTAQKDVASPEALAEAAWPVGFPTRADAPRPALSANAAKALTQFDDWGRLTRWPHKYSVQRLAMWALWIRFDSARRYTEREVNQLLKAWSRIKFVKV